MRRATPKGLIQPSPKRARQLLSKDLPALNAWVLANLSPEAKARLFAHMDAKRAGRKGKVAPDKPKTSGERWQMLINPDPWGEY